MTIVSTWRFALASLFILGFLTFAEIGSLETWFITNVSSGISIELIVMFLLAEPHFAMTIPMLYGYRSLFVSKRTEFILVPALIVSVSSVLFFANPLAFSIIFLLANVYHVNRQSMAVFGLQRKAPKEMLYLYEWFLHFSVILFFALRNLLSENLVLSGLICVTCLILGYVFLGSMHKRFNNGPKSTISDFLSFSQGFLIFAPVCFFENLITAFAIGISIHYLQYLLIAWPICRKSFNFSLVSLVGFIAFYSLVSTGSLSGMISTEKISVFILIPTVLQLLHFYYDGFIWRRSEPVINAAIKKSIG